MKTELVVFDLSGTTVYDDDYVTRSLHQACQEAGIPAEFEVIRRNLGMNKHHLLRYLIALARGVEAKVSSIATIELPEESESTAKRAFEQYEEIMVAVYKKEVRGIDGVEETFRTLHDRGVKIATDTGFHRNITNVIIDSLGWLHDGLIDLALCVEDIPGQRGRPAPYMIFRAMEHLGVHDVRTVMKVGDQPADLVSGHNAGCGAVVGVLTGTAAVDVLGPVRHTHILESVREIPMLLETLESEATT